MPLPRGPRRPSPEELAKRIAARLAESGQPNTKRSSLRDSVLVARLVSGVIVLSTAAVLVLGIFAGVDLLVDSAAVEPPQVLSSEISGEDNPTTTKAVPPPRNPEDFIDPFVEKNETTRLALVTTTIPGAPGIGVHMPATPSTSTTAPRIPSSTTVGSNTSIPLPVTTTQPSTTSSSDRSLPTTSTSTSTVPQPTIPGTTTTVPIPTTTAPTTTTIPTTTTPEATTTTCREKGGGQGKC